MKLFDIDTLAASPWKNGGGATRTLVVSPEGAGFDDFDWRISIADVASSGDFSRFPGVDRIIVLLTGAGMILHINEGSVLPLTTPFQPLPFSGDEMVSSRLLNGPVRDFNVMTRRGRARASVDVWESSFRTSATVCYCARGAFRFEGETIGVGWALQVDRKEEIQFEPVMPDSVMIAVNIGEDS